MKVIANPIDNIKTMYKVILLPLISWFDWESDGLRTMKLFEGWQELDPAELVWPSGQLVQEGERGPL